MGKKRKNFKFRIGADERCYTIEKRVTDKKSESGYSYTPIRWFASAEQLAKGLRDMEARYLVSKGVGIIKALEKGNELVEHLLAAEETEFDLRGWVDDNS